MIPKVIHYCWFGGNPLPKSAKKCIASWKRYCPGYSIVEWNENNFDVHCCPYVEEAYNAKKYAFVSDYVRLYAMYTFGGVYMDTDVELLKNLDVFLNHQGFSGFESETAIPTGIMASEKDFPLFKHLLLYYKERHFINENGDFDQTTNVQIITEILTERGFVPNGMYQVVDGFALYPKDFFCPLDNATGLLHKTDHTAAIHWFNKSWVSPSERIRSKITRIFHRFFGVDCFAFLKHKT